MPFWGEFGWEVLRHVRFIHAHPAQKKVVCCERGKECLYPSATSYHLVDNPIPDNNRTNDGAYHHQPEYAERRASLLEALMTQYQGHQVMDRPPYDCPWHTSDLIRPTLTAKAQLVDVDVAVAARQRHFASEKNWRHWADVIAALRSCGLSVGLTGSPDTTSELEADVKAWDHDGGATAGTVDLLTHCRIFLGTDTGSAHLAALMQTPMIVFRKELAGNPNYTGIMERANKRFCRVLPELAWDWPELVIGAAMLALKNS